MRYVHEVSRRLLLLSAVVAGAIASVAACGDDGVQPTPVPDSGTDAPPITPPRDSGADTGTDAGYPAKLSETGLYSDIAARSLAPGVVRFTPSHPLWADGATKERYLLLPAGTKIDTSDMDRWRFPLGTKAWKSFFVDGKIVETRLLWKIANEGGNSDWLKVAYLWDKDGADATAVPEGATAVLGTTHDVPNQDDCSACHMNVADRIIGFSAVELSDPYDDGGVPPADAGDAGDIGRIFDFAAKGMFTDAPQRHYTVPGAGNDRDAVAYLHGNCGFCHNAGSQLQFQSPIRLRVLTTDTALAQTGAYTTTINVPTRHVDGDVDKVVVPGQPDKSQLFTRMNTVSLVRMPPKATKVIDPTGTTIVRDWILTLPPP